MKIVIVGGGFAGWFTAKTLEKNTTHLVTIIDSSVASRNGIGVGESLGFGIEKPFRELAGLENWMTQCGGLPKLGIKFNKLFDDQVYFGTHWGGWKLNSLKTKNVRDLNVEDDETHTFNEDNILYVLLYMYKEGLITKKQYIDTCNFHSFVLENQIKPYTKEGKLMVCATSYHADSEQMVETLKSLPRPRLKHINKHVNQVNTTDNGYIKNIVLADGEVVNADLFIDCSGLARVIIGKTDAYFNDYSDQLNNSVVTVQTQYINPEKDMLGATEFIGYDCGYGFKVNLYHRIGNGILYNDKVISDEEAQDEFLRKLTLPTITEPRKIKWSPGYHTTPFNKNCLALGMSAGFIEPWDANLISRLCSELYMLLGVLNGKATRSEYNNRYTEIIKEIIDRVKFEFCLSKRDTKYWKWFKEVNSSDALLNNIKDETIHKTIQKTRIFAIRGIYFRNLITKDVDLSKLEINPPSAEHISVAFKYIKDIEEQVKEYNDGTYDNYYTWVKDTFYNGKTNLEVKQEIMGSV